MLGPKIYTAGKIWHAEKFKILRELNYNVCARWIDLDAEHPIVQNDKQLLWQMCYEDVRDCDFVLLYSGDESEELRGALVEVGMAFGMGKPVYAINRCKSLRACPQSDVAFTYHHLFQWLDSTNLVAGAIEAERKFDNLKKEMVA